MSGSAAELTGQMSTGSSLIRYGLSFPTSSATLGACDAPSQIAFTLTKR
jgi:hypothetical protein